MGAESKSSLSFSRCAERSLLSPARVVRTPSGNGTRTSFGRFFRAEARLNTLELEEALRAESLREIAFFLLLDAVVELFLTLVILFFGFMDFGLERFVAFFLVLALARADSFFFCFAIPSSLPVSRAGTARIVEMRCRSRLH